MNYKSYYTVWVIDFRYDKCNRYHAKMIRLLHSMNRGDIFTRIYTDIEASNAALKMTCLDNNFTVSTSLIDAWLHSTLEGPDNVQN